MKQDETGQSVCHKTVDIKIKARKTLKIKGSALFSMDFTPNYTPIFYFYRKTKTRSAKAYGPLPQKRVNIIIEKRRYNLLSYFSDSMSSLIFGNH